MNRDLIEMKDIDSVKVFVGIDGYHRYIYGNFNSIEEAEVVLAKFKQIEAYSAAFIRSISEDMRISEK